MYLYFYDKFAQEKQYEAAIGSIETRLIELGINGRVEKLSIFKNAKHIIEDGIKKGAHTIVAVGDDNTFASVLNVVARYDAALGFIPLSEQSRFARVLGIPVGADACSVLSKRLCETVDVGRIQDHHFLGSLRLNDPTHVTIACDDHYVVSTAKETNMLRILNMGDVLGSIPRLASATDGLLELVIDPMVSGGLFSKRKKGGAPESVFRAKKFIVETSADPSTGAPAQAVTKQPVPTLTADNGPSFPVPCTVEVMPEALKLIVGRERMVE